MLDDVNNISGIEFVFGDFKIARRKQKFFIIGGTNFSSSIYSFTMSFTFKIFD